MKTRQTSKLSIEESLSQANLIVDQVYSGTRHGNAKDDVLSHLLGVDNSGGFRYLGKPRTDVDKLRILVLLTGFDEPEWPDHLDVENGIFTYYGDKRTPGQLHDTGRDGNKTLRSIFERAHDSSSTSPYFPAIFLFSKTKHFRDIKFLGLAVPGATGMSADEDLVAIWRQSSEGDRFQNYKACFTILDCPEIKREWIQDIIKGEALSSPYVPAVWKEWVTKRSYTPLVVDKPSEIRSKQEQTTLTEKELGVISLIYNTFKDSPYEFERVAAKIVKLALPNSHSIELTKPWRDGGRDALGKYRIGKGRGSIDVEFAVEAKCYQLNNGVGVKETSRLISRLRHRQFGVLVTTSYLSKQAYEELITDGHPVIVISANDIARLLTIKFTSISQVLTWITETNF